ncbi:MAG TPA: molybdopterin molybdenumtransferase MoeA, partial [Bdellovibrionales bacterium]|nr:molybdopterin molybdenumtransferase MoeA [Bdellovibrionales bacterium]
VAAGDSINGIQAASGVCCEIMTGAPIPQGFDAIVKVEDAIREKGSDRVKIQRAASAGDHVRRAGEDFSIGTQVLASGTLLRPRHLLPLAAMGLTGFNVIKKPTVAVIPTGTELVDVNCKLLAPSQIRNSTASFLQAELEALGCEVRVHGIIRDNSAEFRGLLERILRENAPDIILTTGAVSMGKFDFIRPALEEMQASICFHKVAIRPGKPLLFADFKKLGKRTVLFGLPGNPVSTAVGVRFFVQPFLKAISQRAPEGALQAVLLEPVSKPEGLTCFFKARVLVDSQGQLGVSILQGQASFRVGPLAEANAWAVLPSAAQELQKGAMISCHLIGSFFNE